MKTREFKQKGNFMAGFSHRHFEKGAAYRLVLVVLAVFLLVFLRAVLGESAQSPQSPVAQTGQEDSLQIGTYDPQQLFNMYKGTQDLRDEIQQMQIQGQMSQQQIQQVVQQKQQELFQNLQNDLMQVIPKSAEEADVAVVAVQVLYHEPEVGIKDLTADLVGRVNQLAEQRGEQQQEPAASLPVVPGAEEK
jgi:hypothetical protein